MPSPSVTIWLSWVLGAYLAGSIPFALLLGKAHGVDIRHQGSGNVGATNLGRALGKRWGVICFLLDAAKGMGPVLGYGLTTGLTGGGGVIEGQASAAAVLIWLVVAVAAIAGHVWPVWLRFKGGKGVATGFGALLGCFPVLSGAGLASMACWLLVVMLSGYVGLGSVVAAVMLPFFTLLIALGLGVGSGQLGVYVATTTLLALMIVLRHRSNIARLRAGTEAKVAWSPAGRAKSQ